MARLRLNPLSDKEVEIKHSSKETLGQILDRVFEEYKIPKESKEYFKILVDGYDINSDFWAYTRVKEGSNILIAVKPKGGSFGQIFKVAALIAITYFAGPAAFAAYGGWGVALGLGITIGSSLLLNALIPPPGLGNNFGSGPQSADSSQMYTITSQSNSVKKYGHVPKVYGKHRIFPTIAASPYTEIETDPTNGELVQFYYAVYDFGLGPLTLEDIKIGDSSITDYSDVFYRLVDFNKPTDGYKGNVANIVSVDEVNKEITIDSDFVTTPEKFYEISYRGISGESFTFTLNVTGTRVAKIVNPIEMPKVGDTIVWGEAGSTAYETFWDALLEKRLTYYKGDVETEDVSASINQNRLDGAAEDDYTVIRNASDLGNGDEQEVTLSFVCPNGLNSFATNGNRGKVDINLYVSFAEEGTEDWIAFNNKDFVSSFKATGGAVESEDFDMVFKLNTYDYNDRFEPTETLLPQISYEGLDTLKVEKVLLYEVPQNIFNFFAGGYEFDRAFYPFSFNYYRFNFGLKAGRRSFKTHNSLGVGSVIEINGKEIGKVLTSDKKFISGVGFEEFYTTTLEDPIAEDIMFLDTYQQFSFDGMNQNEGFSVGMMVLNDQSYMNPYVDDENFQKGGVKKLVPNGSTFRRRQADSGLMVISGNSTEPVYGTLKFTPKESKNYKVRVVRNQTIAQYTYQQTDKLLFQNIVTRFDRDPISTKKRHVFLEVKIRATNQINGAIQNLSGVATSVLDTWDNDNKVWRKKESRNPAWVYADLLTGEVNKNAISKSRLDTDSLYEWSQFCDEIPVHQDPEINFQTSRFSCDLVLDFDTTLQNLLNDIGSAAQASLNSVDGKYGVLIDKKRDIPVQVFTPRNTISFSSSRNYSEPPHALKVKFVDPLSNWELIEKVVYADGYDETNAIDFGELQTFACTNQEQAWRYGRYMMAQAKLRQETISIEVDFEHLVCTRGDFVQITQDVMKVGGTAVRVKKVVGSRIFIDDSFIGGTNIDYGFTVRNSLGDIETGTLRIVDADSADIQTGPIPESGDLFIYGELDRVTFDCMVKSITPNGDLTASLVLVEKADAIYDAEISSSIPDYFPNLNPGQDVDFGVPGPIKNLVVDQNTYRCTGFNYEYYIQLSWNVPDNAAYDIFEIYLDQGKGFDILGYSNKAEFRHIVTETNLGIDHKFKVLAVSANGKKISLSETTEVSATPLTKTSAPSSVESVDLNITGETLQISWTRVTDCDVLEYLIRYSPTVDGTWEGSIPLLRADRKASMAMTQARTGTYLIKAVDFNGNESDLEAKAITTIPELFNLNVVGETNDFPTLPGSLNQVVKEGNALVLQEKNNGDPALIEYWNEGYYYYSDFLDLGEIYTTRLQSLIEAEGFTNDDIMSNWITLDSVPFLAQARQSEWDVRTEVRYTDKFNVMADWVTLDSIDPISEGSQDQWTEWKDFTIGDFTGRIFQFRLKPISNKESVTPRVFDGVIKADMPDRVFSVENEIIPVGGKRVEFNPHFAGPSSGVNLQITQDNAQSGDYYVITDKDLSGVHIEFKDKNDISVERQIDLSVKGYGRKNSVIV